MRNVFLVMMLMVCLFFAGCSLIDTAIPINPETGYREATQLTSDVAGAIPYGSSALAVFLFISNAVIFVKKKKTDDGLWATIKTIDAAAKDPEMKDAIAKLKTQLSTAHKEVNVSPLINRLLSKLKFG